MLDCPDKTEIIIGNAGCGKTTELIKRVADLLEKGVEPDRIAYCSFSVTAIEEAIKRATEKCNLKRDDFPYFRTIHSFAFQLLGLNTQQIMQDYHLRDFGKVMNMKFINSCSKTKTVFTSNDDDKLNIVNIARLCDKPVKTYMQENKIDKYNVSEVEELANMYKNYKITKSIFDYTDMLLLAKTADLDIPELDYLFIDEAQDLSTLQWRIIERLAEYSEHIIIAGDDKQSINVFAGADVDYFLKIPGKVTVLQQSYRTPKRVYDMANKLMRQMSKYREEGADWKPRDEVGAIKYTSYIPFYDIGRGGKWLILTRTNNQLAKIKELFYENCDKATALFTINGEPGLDMDVFRAIELFEMDESPTGITKMDLVQIKDEDDAEKRKKKLEYISLFKKYIGCTSTKNAWELPDSFMKNFKQDKWINAFTKLTIAERRYIAYVLPHYRKHGKDMYNDAPVRLMTIHAAKGTEEDNVVVMTNIPKIISKEMDEDDTEMKVFYVAVTRAKRNLYLYTSAYPKETYKTYIE